VRSDVVVIASIGSQDPAQMRLTQDDEMVHTLAPDRSDKPFGKAILPRRGRRGRLVPDAHGAHSACDNAAIDPIPIADEVAWSLIPLIWSYIKSLMLLFGVVTIDGLLLFPSDGWEPHLH
jgi:hypothetical protein